MKFRKFECRIENELTSASHVCRSGATAGASRRPRPAEARRGLLPPRLHLHGGAEEGEHPQDPVVHREALSRRSPRLEVSGRRSARESLNLPELLFYYVIQLCFRISYDNINSNADKCQNQLRCKYRVSSIEHNSGIIRYRKNDSIRPAVQCTCLAKPLPCASCLQPAYRARKRGGEGLLGVAQLRLLRPRRAHRRQLQPK